MGYCMHGYRDKVANTDCPRCGDRPHTVNVVGAPRAPTTRWRRTGTTMGPTAKLLSTAALVVPLLLMCALFSQARAHLQYVFLVVPIGGFIMLNVRLLPEIWEPGRAPTPSAARGPRSRARAGSPPARR